jgi:M6 family metalloprotease-like protein
MNPKTRWSILGSFAITVCLLVSLLAVDSLGEKGVEAANTTYTLTLNGSNGKITGAYSTSEQVNSSAKTTSGNAFSMTYCNAMASTNTSFDYAQLKKSAGYLYSTNGVLGLTSIKVTFSSPGSFSLYTSDNTTFNGAATVLTSGTAVNVSHNYFKLAAGSNVVYVASIVLTYTCTNAAPSSSNPTSSSTPSSSSASSSSGNVGSYHKASAPAYNLNQVNRSIGYYPLTTTGDQKMLVVPVKTSDGPAWTSAMLERVRIALFGTSAETNYWESVASFYSKSSYGKINITGGFAPVLTISDYTTATLDAKGTNAPDDVVIPKFYATADSSLLKQYDQDGDGRVDATLFVYSNAYSETDGSAYWAWVWYPNNGSNVAKPEISTYFWVSYEFTNEGGTGSAIDAHTFIHECGHILGLDDYYNYDEEYDPAGDREMQSYNIGDQGMFSKYELGWVDPFVLDANHADTVTVPLRSSALYPDCLLLNDSWNGTPNDEYILIEYYTPEGNNYLDSHTQYSSRNLMYTNSGLRIYHVDARLVKLTSSSSTSSTYTDTLNEGGKITFTGASNSTSYSHLSSNASTYKLLSLQQANVTSSSDTDALINGGTASTTGTLYTAGGATWQAYSKIFPSGANTFNDGSSIGYKVKLASVDSSGVAQVQVTRY